MYNRKKYLLQFVTICSQHVILKSYVFIFYIFTTVQTRILVPQELDVKNGMILLWKG